MTDNPPIPHYAVIFASQHLSDAGAELYEETANAMAVLAAQQPGYISHESASNPDGSAITISYWADKAAIKGWKENVEHMAAQRMGLERFYESFTLRIALVESMRSWSR